MFVIIWLVGVFVLGAAIMVVLALQGFEIRPKAFRAPTSRPAPEPQPLPEDHLPLPVRDYLRASLCGAAALPENAAVWGRAQVRYKRRWLPMRFKTLYLPGSAFYRRWQGSWYGMPVARGEEYLRGGRGVIRMSRRAQNGETIDHWNLLKLWVEAVWHPSVYALDGRARWEGLSNLAAELVVPYNGGETRLTAFFDPQTNLLSHFTALQPRSGYARPQLWRVDFSDWERINGVMLPSQAVFRWEDDPQPYARWKIDGAAVNINAARWLGGARLEK